MKEKMRMYVLVVLVCGGCRCEGCYHENEGEPQAAFTSEEQRTYEDLRMEMMREKILDGLGMDKPPKIKYAEQAGLLKNNIQKLPLFLKRGTDINSTVEKKKPSKVVIFAEQGTSTTCSSPDWVLANHSVMSFKLPEWSSKIKDAVLWYKVNESEASPPVLQVSACSCVKPNASSDIKCVKISPKTETNETTKRGWGNFPLSNNWKSVLEGDEHRFLLVTNTKMTITDQKRPFLSMEVYKTKESKRIKREAEVPRPKDCPAEVNRSGERPACCRNSFWVNVTQLGYSDWLLSPAGFRFYYCNGQCERGFDRLVDDNNVELDYSSVLNAYIKRLNLDLKPCCVPKRMTHLPVLITVNGHTATKTRIPNFLVEECACIGFA